MQLLRKNDVRLSLHQPVRYQIVWPSYQPCLSDEIRLHLLYSLFDNVERYCRTYTLSYELLSLLTSRRRCLYLSLSTRVLFIFPWFWRPPGDQSSVNPILNGHHIKRMSGSLYLKVCFPYLLWAYCKTNPWIANTSKGRVSVLLMKVSS